MQVSERCESIAARLATIKRPNRKVTWEMRLRARQLRQRERSERLRIEAPAWAAAVRDYGGVVSKIADRMGYCTVTARKVLRDLGLWRAVVAAREARTYEDHQRARAEAERTTCGEARA